MRRTKRYTIQSGHVIEHQDVIAEINLEPTAQTPKPRGRKTGTTSPAQAKRNVRASIKRLARLLNSNFQPGDLFVTLKYSTDLLPKTKADAHRRVRKFLRRVAAAHQAKTGRPLKWVLVTSDRSSKDHRKVRLHHHIVMDSTAKEFLRVYWPAKSCSFKHLDAGGDYTPVAHYLMKNASPDEKFHAWSSSRNLDKPAVSPPELIKSIGDFPVPSDAFVVDRHQWINEGEGFNSAYIRYVLPPEPEHPCAPKAASPSMRYEPP